MRISFIKNSFPKSYKKIVDYYICKGIIKIPETIDEKEIYCLFKEYEDFNFNWNNKEEKKSCNDFLLDVEKLLGA